MAKKEEAAVFTVAELIAGANHFSVQPEIMAGALYGVTGPITRDEAEKHLKEFKSREVKN